MTTLTLRRANAGDAPAIARVRVDSWRTTYRGLIPDAYLDAMQVEASTALWDRVLTAGPNTTSVFVAEYGTDIVGFACGVELGEPQARLRRRAGGSLPAPRVPARRDRAGGSSARSSKPSARTGRRVC